LVSGERVRSRLPAVAWHWQDRMRPAALMGLGGLVIGVLAFVAWPRTSVIEARFELLPASVDVGDYDAVDNGKVLLNTVCGSVKDTETSAFAVQCRSTEAAAGEGVLRITGPSAAAAKTGLAKVVAHETGLVSSFLVVAQTPAKAGVPAPVADAPLGLTLLGIAAGALLPGMAPRRREPAQAPAVRTLQGALQ
jgi:hypothetical protein